VPFVPSEWAIKEMSICLASLVSIPERIKRLRILSPLLRMIRRFTNIIVCWTRAVEALHLERGVVAMDRVERIFIGTAIVGFLVMAAAIVWMMIA
jgi:hypothetical protein